MVFILYASVLQLARDLSSDERRRDHCDRSLRSQRVIRAAVYVLERTKCRVRLRNGSAL